MIDIDTPESEEKALRMLGENEKTIDIILKYKTKNGWHIVTSPFNPMLVNWPDCTVVVDGLLLLDY